MAWIILALALGAVGFAAWVYVSPGPRAADGRLTDVVISSGGGLRGTARALSDARVIGSPLEFMAAAIVTGTAHRLKAGEYEIPSGASLAQILWSISHGLVARHFITIPEGLTSREAGAILGRADFLNGPVDPPPEGALLPETYEVRLGESRASVFARMMAARDRLLAQLWSKRDPKLPLATPEQAVVLASIIERETARPAERPRIAAVFVNRLRKGMRLESDPTVIYGVSGGEPLGHGLRASELAAPTAYNTYLVGGLPPTPIANPGRASLAAALNPAQTDDLYFVADGSGGHLFAASFAAHKLNVARWRSIEQTRRERPGA